MDDPQTILLVEDNPADIYLIQRAVAECGTGLQLFVVPDGGEALTFLRKEGPFAHVPSPALILLDLHLRKIDGDQILPELRRLPVAQELPIVILSSVAKEREEKRCLQLGATAYVEKPFNFYAYFDALKEIVHTWLRQDRTTSGVSSRERGAGEREPRRIARIRPPVPRRAGPPLHRGRTKRGAQRNADNENVFRPGRRPTWSGRRMPHEESGRFLHSTCRRLSTTPALLPPRCFVREQTRGDRTSDSHARAASDPRELNGYAAVKALPRYEM